MKNKVVIVILCVVFVGSLFAINRVLKKQEQNIDNKNIKEENMSVLEVMSDSFEEEVLKSEKPVLVDFYADWCGPCKMLAPIVDAVAEENSDVKVCRMNIDENEELAVKYGIMSIPTLVVIKNGEEVRRTVGVVGKEEILEMLKEKFLILFLK